MNRIKLLIGIYGIGIVGLFLYSFTQIDLSLTFSRIEILRHIVSSFQYIGYFNRPLSLYIFVGLLVLLYGSYFYLLKLADRKNINKKFVWKLILFSTIALVFSYNAFSYDLFNYIFDAKIFSFYHQNPYIHKALDFPGDPMLSFMRWTHRVYPYGPVWLVLTIPLSYIGHNFFLPTFFLFKLLIASSFLGSVYFISKILQKVKPEKELFGLVFFGLCPYVLIESLVSAHLDIVMIFFALFGFYLLLNKRYIFALLMLAISIGVKFSTLFIIPVFVLTFFLQNRNKINWNVIFNLSMILTTLTVVVASKYSGNFQPWYLLLPMSYAVFISYKYYILIPTVIISLLSLLNYAPYLYFGNYDKPVPQILWNLQIGSIAISFVTIVIYYFLRSKKSKS